MLNVSQLNHFYGESHTLWDLNLDIPRGACTCVMGRNGVGKSTLLRCVMGLEHARDGEISIDSTALKPLPAESRARLGIGYVPQGREIFPRLTVEENLRIGITTRGGKGHAALAQVYDMFPVLKKMLRRRGGDLSGGQQQQLAIGRALVLEPRLLILDEPTEGIQPNIVQEIGDLIIRLNRDLGLTVLLVEQKLPFARRVADRFCVMDKGRVVASDAMDKLSDDLVRQYLSV
jgi:urea transport system ATP-binding protein